MGRDERLALHVLFAHPGGFACRHGEDDNEGVSSSYRALPQSTPNHETIQVCARRHPVWKFFRGDEGKTVAVCCSRVVLTINATFWARVGDGIAMRQGEVRPGRQRPQHRPACRSPAQNLS